MNKVKIIDLLNKIANKENIPETIEFNGEQFWYDEDSENYTYSDQYQNDRWLFDDLYSTPEILNKEVNEYEDDDFATEENLNKVENY